MPSGSANSIAITARIRTGSDAPSRTTAPTTQTSVPVSAVSGGKRAAAGNADALAYQQDEVEFPEGVVMVGITAPGGRRFMTTIAGLAASVCSMTNFRAAPPGIALAGAERAAGRPPAETMNPLKENRPGATDERTDAKKGNTLPAQGEAQTPKPRLPHEHDESADSRAAGRPDDHSQRAFADVARGLVDTDRRSACENPQIAGRLDRRNVERRKEPRR